MTTNIDLENMKKRLNTIEYSLTFLTLDFIYIFLNLQKTIYAKDNKH